MFQGEKIVWRQDNGADAGNATPTALKLYASAGTAIDSTIPIQADVYVGATLMSPVAGRPADRFGVKVDWLRLNQNYAQYLSVAKTVAGGNTSPYNRDTFVFEANAHIQLPLGIGFEPVFGLHGPPDQLLQPDVRGEGQGRRLPRQHRRRPTRRHLRTRRRKLIFL